MKTVSKHTSTFPYEVTFIRKKRMRNICIRVEPFKGIVVSHPFWIAHKKALSFVEEKEKWIKEKISWLEKVEAKKKRVMTERNFNHKQARDDLIMLADDLSRKNHFSIGKIIIRKQKTVWGSCSSKNNISLNIYIWLLPPVLQEYIILHELVHTRVKNHSGIFWKELDKYCANPKGKDKEVGLFSYLLL